MPRSTVRIEYNLPIKVFDFFSGGGGSCKGFQDAGMDIVFALDNDGNARKTFESNFSRVEFCSEDIAKVPIDTLEPTVTKCEGYPKLFSASAPCQPFTKQRTIRPANDGRFNLLGEFQRFVEYYLPEYVFIENVPGLQNVKSTESPFADFLKMLDGFGYKKAVKVINSLDYGVPQRRRRLVVFASRFGGIRIPNATHGPGTRNPVYSKVMDWIRGLPEIKAGETDSTDSNHRAASLSELNLERIRIPRQEWPDRLKLKCHSNGYKGHTDVYTRMRWDHPASGLTTRCISLSNGRFGHPDQDRAISVREAACLQAFPRTFIFHGSLNAMARQIGNAVPVVLAKHFGQHFIRHFERNMKKVP